MKTSILEQLAALEAENAAQARQIARLTQERDALQQNVIDLII